MKLFPLTVRVNAAAPAVTDDGVSEVIDGIGFGASALATSPKPISAIAAKDRTATRTFRPCVLHSVAAAGAIDFIARP